MSQTAATLHQFTFTVSNYNYRPLSGRDTQLNNHHTLFMNSLKDHFIKRFFVVKNWLFMPKMKSPLQHLYCLSLVSITQKQSDYKVEQSSFTLIALFSLEIGRCRGRNWLNGNQALSQ